jgi:MATE family multidrug resistance protein
MSEDRATNEAEHHPFLTHPHRTFFWLSLPVLVSLIAEPMTGLVDTAFVARLGAPPLAALGIATSLLSSVLWVFNFLAIGTQTTVARDLGAGSNEQIARATGTALGLALVLGLLVAAVLFAGGSWASGLLGARGAVLDDALTYLHIRLLGAPAVLATAAVFGALRGVQDMKKPLWIAAGSNLLNAFLDALLIPGWGPIPSLGVAGAAWASTVSQILAAVVAITLVAKRSGITLPRKLRDVTALFVVARDLFFRTGLLLLFLLVATRVANRIGPEAGAAHQAIRQVWMFSAFVLDAFAATAQSLIGYFVGAARIDAARRVAAVGCLWGLATGAIITVAMILGRGGVERLLVPVAAVPWFAMPWLLAAVAQPINALSFVTDGIHWGTSDFRYLRNAMTAASAVGIALLVASERMAFASLSVVWGTTTVWIALRAAFGVLRIWPNGRGPLGVEK